MTAPVLARPRNDIFLFGYPRWNLLPAQASDAAPL